MKCLRFVTLLLLLVMFSDKTLSQESKNHNEGFLTRIEKNLKDTDTPLTETQKEKLKALESGPDYRQNVFYILEDKQKETLKKVLGNSTSRNNSSGNRAKSRGSSNSSSNMSGARESNSQNNSLRRRNQRTRNTEKADIKNIAKQLRQARCSLTPTQVEYLLKIGEDPDFNKKMMGVLEDKQKEVLKNTSRKGNRSSRGGGGGRGGGGRR